MKQRERLIELLDNYMGNEFLKNDGLADYLLANGVIVPPCKVGDTVYYVSEDTVLSDEITLIEVTESAMYLSTCSERYMLNNGCLYSEMLDKKAYFTKEEAVEALKSNSRPHENDRHEQLSNPKIMNAIIKTMLNGNG